MNQELEAIKILLRKHVTAARNAIYNSFNDPAYDLPDNAQRTQFLCNWMIGRLSMDSAFDFFKYEVTAPDCCNYRLMIHTINGTLMVDMITIINALPSISIPELLNMAVHSI